MQLRRATSMIDGVIFDLDGTLWDTTEELYKCYKRLIPSIDLLDIKSCMGLTPEQIANKLGIQIELLQSIQNQEIDWLSQHPVTPYMGVTTTLTYLRTLGISCFIVSNCQKGYIECFLQSNPYLIQYFDGWICYEATNKPKYENIKLIINEHHLINPIYVGDTESDLIAAKQAGVKFVGVKYGFGKLQDGITSIMDLMGVINNVQN